MPRAVHQRSKRRARRPVPRLKRRLGRAPTLAPTRAPTLRTLHVILVLKKGKVDKLADGAGTAASAAADKDAEAPSGASADSSESAAVSPSATAAVASDTSPPRKRARSASRSPSPERTNRQNKRKHHHRTPSQNSDATTATSGNLEATQEVASNLCGILIGRGGSIISQMRAQSGSRITISPAGQTPSTRTICYTGTASAIALAQSLVVQQLRSNNAPLDALGAASAPAPAGTAIRKNNMTRTETIACPMTHVGGLIGKGGSVINQLRAQSGAELRSEIKSQVQCIAML